MPLIKQSELASNYNHTRNGDLSTGVGLRMKKLLLVVFILSVAASSVSAQKKTTSSKPSLLWEVTGNNARDTSYLFGTFHAFKSGLVDTLPAVMSRFKRSTAVVGEMLLTDPSIMLKTAGMMRSPTPLKKLLDSNDYRYADSVFKSITGYGIGFFNTVKPMAAQTQMVQSLFSKIYPTHSHPNEEIIDIYFQNKGVADNKPVFGLETIEEQMQLLFGDITIERQAEMFMQSIRELDSSKIMLTKLADCYIANDLDCLETLGSASDGFSLEEMDALVKTRNENWLKQLPGLMKEHRLFVAVGALHLPGEHGVVNLLRKQGYTVTPVAIH